MASYAARPGKRILVEADVRIVAVNAWLNRAVLMALLVMLYVSYGAIGRDVFFNQLNYQRGTVLDDPIGAVLPYVRVSLCALTLLLVTMGTDVKWVLSKIPWTLSPFIALALISTLWADDPKNTLRNAITTMTMWLALPPLIHRLGMVTSARVTLHVIAVVCILSLILALVAPTIGRHSGLELIQSSHKGEWRGLFSHKNLLGPWAALGTVLCFAYSKLGGGIRLYWWFAAVCALTCLVFSNSATSEVVGVVIGAAWLGFMALRRFSLSAVFLFYLLPGLIIGLIAFVFKGELLGLLGRDETFTGRTAIWEIDWQFFVQRPWFGHGFQTGGGPIFLNRLIAVLGQPLSAESAYWEMLLDSGIVGLLLFMIPMSMAMRNGFEWLKHVALADRAAIEMCILILISALITAFTETQVLLSTGYDGVLSFTAFFALLTTPKSPEGVLRGEFRIAEHRINPFLPSPAQQTGHGLRAER